MKANQVAISISGLASGSASLISPSERMEDLGYAMLCCAYCAVLCCAVFELYLIQFNLLQFNSCSRFFQAFFRHLLSTSLLVVENVLGSLRL